MSRKAPSSSIVARALPPLEAVRVPSSTDAAAQGMRSALGSLSTHKLRSALTMIGIVAGICGFLLINSLGTVADNMVAGQMAQVGSNQVDARITVGDAVGSGASGNRAEFSEADAQAISRQVPHVVAVSPREFLPAQLVAGGKNWKASVGGVYPDYQVIQSFQTTSGAFFTNQDETVGTPVAVIGPTIVSQLFPSADPIGQTLRINNVDFRIVGVLAPKGASTSSAGLDAATSGHMVEMSHRTSAGSNLDDTAYVPYSTLHQRLTTHNFTAMSIQVDQPENISGVITSVTKILAQSRQIPEGAPLDFKVTTFAQTVQALQQEMGGTESIMTLIAGIALLIGGFGVANIMLLSVTERTREIGLRIAVGAMPRDVMLQFLFEATTISLLGGLVGLVAGVALAAAATSMLIKYTVTPTIAGIAVVLVASSLIGMVFGYYPARRAARLNPIDALRHV